MSEHQVGSPPRSVVLLGGTSEIGLAIARRLLADRAGDAVLAGRDGAALEQSAQQLRALSGRQVRVVEGLDADAVERHGELIERALSEVAGAEPVLVLAVGQLGARGGLPDDIGAALHLLDVNVRGSASMLLHGARLLKQRGSGTIIVISSIAAERPRRANAVYAASKAAIDGLAQGIGDDLSGSGVRVLVVRPGFVRTRMTQGLKPAPFACDPDDVAAATLRGLRRHAHTVWAPPAVRVISVLMRLIPRPLFKRLPL